MNITELAPNYAVTPQVEVQDIPQIKALGYDVLINNRPDGEADDQPNEADIRAAAEQAGLAYLHNPVDLKSLSNAEVAAQQSIIKDGDKVLAFCRTGTRSSVLWVLAEQQDEASFIEHVAHVMKKGFDLGRCLPAMERLKKR